MTITEATRAVDTLRVPGCPARCSCWLPNTVAKMNRYSRGRPIVKNSACGLRVITFLT